MDTPFRYELQLQAHTLLHLVELGLGFVDAKISPSFIWKGKQAVAERVRLEADGGSVVSVPATLASYGVHGPDGAHSVDGATRVQIVTPWLVDIVTMDDMTGNNTGPSTAATVSITCKFGFNSAIDSQHQLRLRLQVDEIDLGPELGAVANAQALAESLTWSFESDPYFEEASPNIQLSDALLQDFLDDVDVSNTTAVLDPTGSFVSALVELGGPYEDSVSTFTNFFHRNVTDRLDGRSLGLFLPTDSVVPRLKASVQAQLDAKVTAGEISDVGLSTNWDPNDVKLTLHVIGQAVDACPIVAPGYYNEVDVNFETNIEVQISVPDTNKIAVDLKSFTDLNDEEVAGCTFSFGTPFVGEILASWWAISKAGAKQNYGWQIGLIAALGTSFSSNIAFLAGASNSGKAVAEPLLSGAVPDAQEVKPTDADVEFRQETDLNFPTKGIITVQIDEVAGFADGLAFRGDFLGIGGAVFRSLSLQAETSPTPKAPTTQPETSVHPANLVAPAVLEVLPHEPAFRWGWASKCDESSKYGARVTINLNDGQVAPWHRLLRVHDVSVLADAAGQFWNAITVEHWLNGDGASLVVVVPYAALKSAYTENPYSMQMLVRTSGGARILTVPAPAIPTSQSVKMAQMAHTADLKILCRTMFEVSLEKVAKLFWAVDPPPFEAVVEQLWRLTATHAEATGKLVARDARGAVVAELAVAAKGSGAIAWTTRETDHVDVAFEGPGGKVAFEVLQLAYTLCHRVAFGEPLLGVEQGALDGIPVAVCRTAERVLAVGLADPNRPGVVRSVRAEGNIGAIAYRGALVSWGPHGVTVHDTSGTRQLVEAAVRDVEVFRGKLYVLEAKYLSIWDTNLTAPIERLACEGRALARTGRNLVVETATGILRVPTKAGQAFAHMSDAELQTMGVHSRRRTRIRIRPSLAHTGAPPWPLTAPRVGRALTRITEDGALELWTFAGAHQSCSGDAPRSK